MSYQFGFYFKLLLLLALVSFLPFPLSRSLATRQGLKLALPFLGANFNASAQDAQGEQRGKARTLTFTHEPPDVIEVVKISGHKSENWLDDFELELKNKSGKPIYYIEILLEIPEMNRSEKIREIFPLIFGEPELFATNARPTDLEKSPHLFPGESVKLKISEKQRRGFKINVERRLKEASLQTDQVTKFILHFNLVKFGDGTGIFGRDQKLGTE